LITEFPASPAFVVRLHCISAGCAQQQLPFNLLTSRPQRHFPTKLCPADRQHFAIPRRAGDHEMHTNQNYLKACKGRINQTPTAAAAPQSVMPGGN
jgi:hypothetical protein